MRIFINSTGLVITINLMFFKSFSPIVVLKAFTKVIIFMAPNFDYLMVGCSGNMYKHFASKGFL